MAVPIEGGMQFISMEEIIHCEGVNGYTKIYLANQKEILSSKSLGYYSGVLTQRFFYQVHRSHIINLRHITKYLKEGIVYLSNKCEVPVSRNRKNEFLAVLERF